MIEPVTQGRARQVTTLDVEPSSFSPWGDILERAFQYDTPEQSTSVP